MAKLTKKQELHLIRILSDLNQGRNYLKRPDIAVARQGMPATTTLHYVRADGDTLYPINKEIGSDLCGIYRAHDQLFNFLEENL